MMLRLMEEQCRLDVLRNKGLQPLSVSKRYVGIYQMTFFEVVGLAFVSWQACHIYSVTPGQRALFWTSGVGCIGNCNGVSDRPSLFHAQSCQQHELAGCSMNPSVS